MFWLDKYRRRYSASNLTFRMCAPTWTTFALACCIYLFGFCRPDGLSACSVIYVDFTCLRTTYNAVGFLHSISQRIIALTRFAAMYPKHVESQRSTLCADDLPIRPLFL